MTDFIDGWHFLPKNRRLRYSQSTEEIRQGSVVEENVIPKLCEKGLHCCPTALATLSYLPGFELCRVRVSGNLQIGDDKVCGTRREVLYGPVTATDDVVQFAKDCAERAKSAIERHRDTKMTPAEAIKAEREWQENHLDTLFRRRLGIIGDAK